MSLWKRFKAWMDREAELIAAHDWDPRTPEQRTADVMARLQFARDEMRRRGTPTLLDGRPAWQRINPMGTEKPAKVVSMRRAKR